jgi:hypothetical protein
MAIAGMGREYALAILKSGLSRCIQNNTAKEYLSVGPTSRLSP